MSQQINITMRAVNSPINIKASTVKPINIKMQVAASRSWSDITDKPAHIINLEQLLDQKVNKEEGYSLISIEEILRLAEVHNYDDSTIVEAINTLSQEIDNKQDNLGYTPEDEANKVNQIEKLIENCSPYRYPSEYGVRDALNNLSISPTAKPWGFFGLTHDQAGHLDDAIRFDVSKGHFIFNDLDPWAIDLNAKKTYLIMLNCRATFSDLKYGQFRVQLCDMTAGNPIYPFDGISVPQGYFAHSYGFAQSSESNGTTLFGVCSFPVKTSIKPRISQSVAVNSFLMDSTYLFIMEIGDDLQGTK